MQSLQLTCSLTPSSTEPSTWLVIIWLKRWFARPSMDLPLLPPSVGVGLGEGEGVGDGEALGDGDGLGDGEYVEQFSKHSCAVAERVCMIVSTHENAAVS